MTLPQTGEPLSLNTTNVLTVAPDNAPRRRFLTPLPEPGHFLLVLDNSALEKWKRCAMAARNYLLLGREAHARDAALTFGGAVHVGLETLLRGKLRLMTDSSGEGTFRDETDEAFDRRLVQSILRYFTENPTPPDEYRTPGCAVEVLAHYRQRATMPDYAWEILSDDVGPLIERAFEIPLGVLEVGSWIRGLDFGPQFWRENNKQFRDYNPDLDGGSIFVSHIHIAWSGRIDVVARCGPGNAVRVVDHKTTSRGDDNFVSSFYLSSQVSGYVWAAQQMWPELDVHSFCLNAIFLKKPGKAQGLLDKGVRGGAPPLQFFRAYYERTPARVEQWKTDTMNHISDMINCLIRNVWPLNDESCFCHKFEGKCNYHDACVIEDPVVRDRLLNSDAFKPVTWNPVADR